MPVITIPRTKKRCAAKKSAMHGSDAITAAAINRCSFGSPGSAGDVWKRRRPSETVKLVSVLRKINGWMNSFLQHWNEFIQPLIFLNTDTNFTVSLGLRLFQTSPADPGEPKEHLLMAAAVIASLPCIALFFAAQRFFVRGIVMTGIKG